MTSSTSDDLTPNPEASARRWIFATLGAIAAIVAIHIVIARQLDLFGIFRDTHGRALITSDHERKDKYLLNQAYVPQNFDALIIGASASVNWHPEDLTGFRFYNESIEGGDASEQRKLVEQALPHGRFKVALVALYPRITGLHVLQDGFDQVKRGEALGSISALGIEYDYVMDRIQHRPATIFPNGSHVLPNHAHPVPNLARGPIDLSQDEQAVADYRDLVKELIDQGARIVYVVMPLFQPSYVANKDGMADYVASVERTMPPAPMIDFNAPEYASFRSDPTNFIDDLHLSEQGAKTLSLLLNDKMHQLLGPQ